MNIAGFVALCSTVVLSAVGVGSAVNLEKTEEVNKKVAQVESAPRDTYNNYGVVNNYETHNHYEEVTKEVVETVDEEEVKEMVHDAYFEERVKEAEETSNQLTYEELQALIYDGSENAPTNSSSSNDSLYPNLSTDNTSSSTGFRSVLQCEVCEKTGTELEVWYDVNNIKHYTCKDKCTNGLDVLYGR